MLGTQPPIANEGDLCDFVFGDENMASGKVITVIDNTPFQHAYVIYHQGERYRVFEEHVSTPFGDDDLIT